MFCQWPLALYLSRTGCLDRAIGLSGILFAVFLGAICFLTGGLQSFAIMWLVLPPIEAAFAGRRTTAATVTGVAAAILTGLAILAPIAPIVGPVPPFAQAVTVFAAVVYAGVLALRIASDRQTARELVAWSNRKFETLSTLGSDVVGELSDGGKVQVLGGPAAEIFGAAPARAGSDWLFHRVHVADRPLFLTQYSNVRETGNPVSFCLRIRTGEELPGEAGQATHQSMQVRLSADPGLKPGNGGSRDFPVLIALRISEADAEPLAEQNQAGEKSVTSDLMQLLAQRHWDALSRVEQVHASHRSPANGDLDAAIVAARATLQDFQGVLSDHAVPKGAPPAAMRQVRLADVSERICSMLAPAAEKAGVTLQPEGLEGLPEISADGGLLRQAMCVLVFTMIETAERDAQVSIHASRLGARVEVKLSVSQPNAALKWSCWPSDAVVNKAGLQLKQAGADLRIDRTLGSGDRIIISFPVHLPTAMLADGSELKSTVQSPIQKAG
ncbi:hypothetical protein GCM10009077_05730 [Roseibium denhamense]